MNPTVFLIGLLDASGGSVRGRTYLQKLTYFVTLLADVKLELGFDAHFYGPYSEIVENALIQLKNLNFLEERAMPYGIDNTGFEMKRYDYRLTPDGKKIAERLRGTNEFTKITEAVNRILSAGNLSYMELSIAAKAYYILARRDEPLSKEDLIREARKFDWKLPPNSLGTAVSFLEKLGVVRA